MALVRGDDGTIIEANDALGEMTGHQAGRLSGRRLETLYHAEERQGLRQRLESLRGGALGHLDEEARYVHREGHVVHAQVRARWSARAQTATSSCRSSTSRTASASRASCAGSPTTTR